MKRKLKYEMFLLILLLAMGFAAVSTSLIINGTGVFGTNESDFEVIFTKSVIDGVDVSNETISNDGKSLTFETSNLAILGDSSKLEFEVTNNSKQYDAEITIECIKEGEHANIYYEITSDIPDVIKSLRTESGSVFIKLLKTSVDEIEEKITCTINAQALERNVVGRKENPMLIVDNNMNGQADIGDEISIGEEEFYVIKNEDNVIKMLSKYNLDINAGVNIYKGTGIQNSYVLGYKENMNVYGTIYFSSDTNRGENYSDYEGSTISSFVDEYSFYLEDVLGVENEATLITLDELNALECSSAALICTNSSYPWVYSTSYWTMTAETEENVWRVDSMGHLNPFIYNQKLSFGVRPVISISERLMVK